ncbi:MFS transporter [Burkholderia multivorans]|uniref:MFS transporter n=1 Tax=Burkholderia multivorans TaxID=87883 RepID=UPI0021C00E6F|nr:MFS transporter [Burkholderia multivorans]
METAKPGHRSGSNHWFILGLLALGVLISFVDRSSISSALADASFVTRFSLTSIDRGWINAAFFWSYGLFQVPMGWVADRYGVKWPYAICFALWCIATALMGAVSTLAGLVVMRLVIGVAEAIVIPASYRWIRNNFDERRNGLAVGLLAMGNKLGPAIGAPVAAWVIVAWSWKAMFVATGLLGLLWLAPWLLLVRNDLPSRESLRHARRTARSVSLGSVLASPVVWGGMITNFCYGYFTFYSMTWMPAYLVEQRGLSLAQSGLYTFFSFVGIAVVAALAGWAADLVIARRQPARRTQGLHDRRLLRRQHRTARRVRAFARHGAVLERAVAVVARLHDCKQSRAVAAHADSARSDRTRDRRAAGRDEPCRRRRGESVRVASARQQQLRPADDGDPRVLADRRSRDADAVSP